MKKVLLATLLLSSHIFASATTHIVNNSEQLIVVTTSDWKSINGKMQRFERNSTQQSWKPIGSPVNVVIGKNGMGWDAHFKPSKNNAPIKHEGDGLTPAGIYPIGPTFGFDETSQNTNYFPLNDTSVCVDDVKSTHYNQLIDSTKMTLKDWNSGEQMRQVPQYQFGAMVQYNQKPITAGAGSCIFMHIWKSSTSGTAGCIAMEESNLKNVLAWLDGRKHPIIAIFPQQAPLI